MLGRHPDPDLLMGILAGSDSLVLYQGSKCLKEYCRWRELERPLEGFTWRLVNALTARWAGLQKQFETSLFSWHIHSSKST
jgi:hypothetical protein